MAAVAHLLAWIGWRQAEELVSLQWSAIKIICPALGPSVGLALGMGAIELWFLPKTKLNWTKIAEVVVISYVSASSLVPGLWLERLPAIWFTDLVTPLLFMASLAPGGPASCPSRPTTCMCGFFSCGPRVTFFFGRLLIRLLATKLLIFLFYGVIPTRWMQQFLH